MAPEPDTADSRRVEPSPRRTARGAAIRAWLPEGRALSERDAAWRHRVVLVVVAAHLPVLALVGPLTGHTWTHTAVDLVPVLVLLGLALAPLGRRPRALAGSIGLVTCSALLVHLFHGQTELHFHFFVAVAVIALYQDWTVFAAAIAFVAIEHGVVGVLTPRDVYDHGGDPLGWALVHAGFVLAECAVLVVFWRADEQTRAGGDQLQIALWEGQASVRARLEETERIRTDLIGTVSHEFRTPLTGIRGTALTLLKRGDRLDESARRQLLQGMLEQQERLSRLLENMLTAARATAADPTAVSDVTAVATEVVMLAKASRPNSPRISLLIEPGTVARIDRAALHQVLANLVDNAQQHGEPGSLPLIAGGLDGTDAWVAVSNEGGPLDVQAARLLFEPFTQADAGSTRTHEGLGMGLYVVRRLIEVYEGSVTVRAESGWVTVEVRLPAVPQEPTAVPTRKVTPAAAAPSSS
ncbi:MAG: integral rane sensor signal transduction histidine kinase [Frankiales bacterium]|nr:integral rane sensor signal transduction histidine kinase [Frankiales bacterium]